MPGYRHALNAAVVGGVIAIIAIMILVVRGERPETPSDPDRIRVVAAPPSVAGVAAVTSRSAQAPTVAATARAGDIATAALEAFPMLYEAKIDCDPDCVFIATLGPNAATGDWPRSQWPYDGNLERFLADRGYMPRGALDIDQPGDSDTLLRVPVERR